MRHSDIAYVLIRLQAEGEDCVLLHRHEKWGDWTLVGGHVEPGEEENWLQSAAREAAEELAPLRLGEDFEVEPLEVKVEWGPEPSRSARGEPTEYRAEYFLLKFLKDPRELLAVLPASDFRLVPIASLDASEVSNPVRMFFRQCASRAPLPYSWREGLPSMPKYSPAFGEAGIG